VPKTLRIVWISCDAGDTAADLFQECQQACRVTICFPSQALGTIRRAVPDLVIFDYGDPRAADLHLLQSVKRQYPRIPVLMLTDSHSEDLAAWAMRARVWNYLVKRVPLRELKTTLKKLVIPPYRHGSDTPVTPRMAALPPKSHANLNPESGGTMLHRFAEDIRRNCLSEHNVAQLAQSCGMSRFSFSRQFRDNYGISFRDYVMRQRLETACKMLELHGFPVNRAALAAGFTDASYFARVFKRHFRKSPGEYARAARSRLRIDQLFQE
jgi:AraC-like DNA-binding protein/CheY-like chemotaxis protein